MTGQRVTIILNDKVMEKTRNLQSKWIKESQKTVSFSSVVNTLLDEAL